MKKFYRTICLCIILHLSKAYKPSDESVTSAKSVTNEVENGRIIGGTQAKPGQFPFQALLNMQGPDMSNEQCGGVLISDRFVMTAAHCSPFPSIDVILGVLFSMVAENTTVKMTVKKPDIIVHPEFDKYMFLNDIALLRLPKAVTPTKYIQPINLPKKSQIPPNTFINADLIISGWGLTSNKDLTTSDPLMFAHVKLEDHTDCLNFYEVFDINDSQICTSYNGKGTCNGDSGGPMFTYESKKPVLVGIISFGVSDCERKAPSVYTNVAYFLDWIHNITNITVS